MDEVLVGDLRSHLAKTSVRKHDILEDFLLSKGLNEFIVEVNRLSEHEAPAASDPEALLSFYRFPIDKVLASHSKLKWDDMFIDCSTETGKELSRDNRRILRDSSMTLIYGEITYESFCHILWHPSCGLRDMPISRPSEPSADPAFSDTVLCEAPVQLADIPTAIPSETSAGDSQVGAASVANVSVAADDTLSQNIAALNITASTSNPDNTPQPISTTTTTTIADDPTSTSPPPASSPAPHVTFKAPTGSMPSKSGVIYDLGSGTARAVLAAPFLHTFHRVVGIELLENLHDAAVKCLGRYEAMVSAGEAPACDIELICGSFFDYDWSDGDVIFANSTCFSDEMFEEIGKRCVTLRSGAIVITFSVELTGEHLETLHQMELVMSWGKVNVFIHKRI